MNGEDSWNTAMWGITSGFALFAKDRIDLQRMKYIFFQLYPMAPQYMGACTCLTDQPDFIVCSFMFFCLFDSSLNVPVNNLSVMLGRVFLGLISTRTTHKQG